MTQIFPKWTNALPTVGAALAALGAPAVVFSIWYWFSPWYTDVGYAPEQPVPYSHQLHAGTFGMDCRYCHQNVEKGPHATIPATETCMNCHHQVKTDSDKLAPVRESHATGKPIEWVKVHMLPDYAFFDHSAHVNIKGQAGVGCESCHGRVDKMEIVRQTQPLSMGWCLECHRSPEKHVRPHADITKMGYAHDEKVAKDLIKQLNINPPTHCSACHR